MVGDPSTQDGGAHVDTTEARAGSTSGTVRRVLVIGTLLAALLMGAVVLFGFADTDTDLPSVSNEIANSEESSQRREDIDGVVGMDDDAASFGSEGTSPRLQEN
ncbi:hypothetical protein [Croceibacterium ferulae]|uniref:hypothetical protein n=1 Tax=Croceibacterium ferulae TaxID=1854641 RepID=UPI000EAE9F72|nr:hypothetical protein [Croceibacterium ferulae]